MYVIYNVGEEHEQSIRKFAGKEAWIKWIV
jgi:hypothetical protein